MFVGDDAFPLKTYMVKPYPKGNIQFPEMIANYRISSARIIVENAFDIAASRFRLFSRAITADVEVAVAATKSVIALHNCLLADMSFPENPYCPPDYIELEFNGYVRHGGWRSENASSRIQDIRNLGSNNYSLVAKNVRHSFRDYFHSSSGSVPWQDALVTSTSYIFDRVLEQ